jgi:hypothetical protein
VSRNLRAADLAAITQETLKELALQIRNSNSDTYKRYWNRDPHNRPTQPLPEEGCRDVLLDQLRDRFRALGIEIQPEVRCADAKRADLRVSYTAPNTFAGIDSWREPQINQSEDRCGTQDPE